MAFSLASFSGLKTYAWALAILLTVGAFSFTTAAAYKWGKENGTQSIQVKWDAETKTRLQGDFNKLDSTLKQSRTDAAAAAEQSRKDMAAALAASETRQAERIQAAVRQAALESLTRKPGSAYVDPRCQLDDAAFKQLNGALKK